MTRTFIDVRRREFPALAELSRFDCSRVEFRRSLFTFFGDRP